MNAEARTNRLVDARRLSAARKRRHTLRAIEAARRRGDRITFACIAREAAVSSWFVRNQPDVRAAIDQAMREQQTEPTPDKRTLRSASADGLRSELLLARDEIRELRTERDRLRTQVRRDLGDALDHASRWELLERIADLERSNHDLAAEHAAAQHAASQLQAAAVADLAAARAANRRLMQQVNTSLN